MAKPLLYFNHMDRKPADCQCLFSVYPPVVLPDGIVANYVVAGFPMESWVGPDYGAQIFASDTEGNVVDWGTPVYDSNEWNNPLVPKEWPQNWYDILIDAF